MSEYSNHTLHMYLRVSRKGDKSEFSIDDQKKKGIDFCKKSKFKGYKIWNEGEGVSGGSNKRKVFNDLIESIEVGEVKYLYVREWDRFSRLDEKDFVELKITLSENDVIVFDEFNDKGYDLKDPDSELIISIKNILANRERKKIIKRQKGGLKGLNERGGRGGKVVNYGYRKDENGILEIDEDEKKVYLMMVSMVMRGMNVSQITKELNAKKIPTKKQNIFKASQLIQYNYGETSKLIAEHKWNDNTVRGILKHTIYKGDREYLGEPLKDNVPPIPSEKKWDEVTTKLERNTQLNRNKQSCKHFHLLSGRLFCKKCGRILYGVWKTDEKTYRCKGKIRKNLKEGEELCKLRSINHIKVEQMVIENVIVEMSKYEDLNNILKEEKNNNKKRNEDLLSKLRKEKEKILERKKGWRKMYFNGDVKMEDFNIGNEELENMMELSEEKIQNELNNVKLEENRLKWVD